MKDVLTHFDHLCVKARLGQLDHLMGVCHLCGASENTENHIETTSKSMDKIDTGIVKQRLGEIK